MTRSAGLKIIRWHSIGIQSVRVDVNRYNVYAIGDVHGCNSEMIELIEKCLVHCYKEEKFAKIYLLGDLIDRGPDFFEVFLSLQHTFIECIIGNHELNFYLERMGKECRSRSRKVSHDKFDALEEQHQDFVMKSIGDMPNAAIVELFDDTGDMDMVPFLLSHSPIRNIEYIETDGVYSTLNAPQCCMRSTEIDMNALDKTTNGCVLVHGHQSWNFKPVPEQLEDQEKYNNKVINIDSGCVYGEKLTALCLNSLEVIEVQAKKAYSTRH